MWIPDATTKDYGANVIVENLLALCGDDGMHPQLLSGIIDHKRTGDEIKMKDKFVINKFGNGKLRKTTVGWLFNVKWKDGTKTWIPLNVLKESNPVEVAEYVQARSLDDEPAFA